MPMDVRPTSRHKSRSGRPLLWTAIPYLAVLYLAVGMLFGGLPHTTPVARAEFESTQRRDYSGGARNPGIAHGNKGRSLLSDERRHHGFNSDGNCISNFRMYLQNSRICFEKEYFWCVDGAWIQTKEPCEEL